MHRCPPNDAPMALYWNLTGDGAASPARGRPEVDDTPASMRHVVHTGLARALTFGSPVAMRARLHPGCADGPLAHALEGLGAELIVAPGDDRERDRSTPGLMQLFADDVIRLPHLRRLVVLGSVETPAVLSRFVGRLACDLVLLPAEERARALTRRPTRGLAFQDA